MEENNIYSPPISNIDNKEIKNSILIKITKITLVPYILLWSFAILFILFIFVSQRTIDLPTILAALTIFFVFTFITLSPMLLFYNLSSKTPSVSKIKTLKSNLFTGVLIFSLFILFYILNKTDSLVMSISLGALLTLPYFLSTISILKMPKFTNDLSKSGNS